MPKTFNVDMHIIQIGRVRLNPPARQLIAAQEFFDQFKILVTFKLRSLPTLTLDGERDFFAPSDWRAIGASCSQSQKGCDLFIVPKMEKIEGYSPYGLTVLPGKKPPEGIPQSATGVTPSPDPSRPAVIFNMEHEGQTLNTVLHELGHALLNSSAHHSKSGNFMHADPPQQRREFEAAQIARMYDSQWLV